MTVNTEEIIATCPSCGFHLDTAFPQSDLADDSGCPQCGHALVDIPAEYPDDLTISRMLRKGWQIDRVPREFVCGLLEKASLQGLETIDLRISCSDGCGDDVTIEVLSVT